MALELMIGLGIAGFLFLYFAFNLSEGEENKPNHFLLKLLLIFFFFYTITLMPKAAIDSKTVCDFVIANVTTSAPTDTYKYVEQCYTTSTTTELTFLKMAGWAIRLFGVYILVFLLYNWAMKSERFAALVDRITGRVA